MDSQLVLVWRRYRNVYRGYILRHPDIKAEGRTPFDVEEKIRKIIDQRMAEDINEMNVFPEIYAIKDERPAREIIDDDGNRLTITDFDDDTWEMMLESSLPGYQPKAHLRHEIDWDLFQ